MFADIYKNRRILITGHTGFKGSWLALWLKKLGAEITGIALPPESTPNHWDLLGLDIKDHRVDIRDFEAVSRIVKQCNPEIVFHLAAQSLVRRSYRTPRETWETNVMGSCNLLESCRDLPDLKAIVFITTDKCYEVSPAAQKYTEDDKLGGHDPYSASKASCEFVAASYRDSFFKNTPLIATTRAGNVIGGGDWAEDRIIPDLARAQDKGIDLIVRSPDAVRPWQHVLEPLSGYLQLGQRLVEGDQSFQGPWNFGPDDGGILSVSGLLNKMGASWKAVPDHQFHETKILMLDSTKAQKKLKWHPVMTVDDQIAMTADWYNAFHQSKNVLSEEQLGSYQEMAKVRNIEWAIQ